MSDFLDTLTIEDVTLTQASEEVVEEAVNSIDDFEYFLTICNVHPDHIQEIIDWLDSFEQYLEYSLIEENKVGFTNEFVMNSRDAKILTFGIRQMHFPTMHSCLRFVGTMCERYVHFSISTKDKKIIDRMRFDSLNMRKLHDNFHSLTHSDCMKVEDFVRVCQVLMNDKWPENYLKDAVDEYVHNDYHMYTRDSIYGKNIFISKAMKVVGKALKKQFTWTFNENPVELKDYVKRVINCTNILNDADKRPVVYLNEKFDFNRIAENYGARLWLFTHTAIGGYKNVEMTSKYRNKLTEVQEFLYERMKTDRHLMVRPAMSYEIHKVSGGPVVRLLMYFGPLHNKRSSYMTRLAICAIGLVVPINRFKELFCDMLKDSHNRQFVVHDQNDENPEEPVMTMTIETNEDTGTTRVLMTKNAKELAESVDNDDDSVLSTDDLTLVGQPGDCDESDEWKSYNELENTRSTQSSKKKHRSPIYNDFEEDLWFCNEEALKDYRRECDRIMEEQEEMREEQRQAARQYGRSMKFSTKSMSKSACQRPTMRMQQRNMRRH